MNYLKTIKIKQKNYKNKLNNINKKKKNIINYNYNKKI
jgi:hypothetical protein